MSFSRQTSGLDFFKGFPAIRASPTVLLDTENDPIERPTFQQTVPSP